MQITRLDALRPRPSRSLALLSAVISSGGALAQDVTSPGNTIVGSSANYPAGEAPEFVIDNTASTKYLNFDELNTGFTVTPSAPSVVRGLVIITANDAPERDPTSFTLEGSDDGSTFFFIASGPLAPPTARFALDQVRFANETAYAHYRVTFPTVRNPGGANSMQVGEVQLIDGGGADTLTAGDPFTITYTPGGSSQPNEGPANLWDGRLFTKLGVFGGSLGPTTIDVTPGFGVTTVSGIDIFGGSDDAGFPGRTPSSVTVLGSNDGVSYTQIGTGPLTQVTRNYEDQQLAFANLLSFTRYRIVLGPSSDFFMQVGEIQLIGSAGTLPPDNDSCGSAQSIAVGSTAGSNFNATGADTTPCGDSDSDDVWFSYTPGAPGLLEVNTFGAGTLDTTLAVYDGCGGPLMGCNDNARGSGSRVRWTGESGHTYLIRVAGANDGNGTFTLELNNSPESHDDLSVPLACNFNGIVHAGEASDADNPIGYRSISDRGLRATGAVGSIEVGLEGTTGIPYTVASDPFELDMVHLGNRNAVDNGNWAFDFEPDFDDIGVQPLWLVNPDQTTAQSTDVTALGLSMGPQTRIGVLHNASNGGSSFDLTLTFSDATSVTVQLDAPDWFGVQVVDPPNAGVEAQVALGTFFGAHANDTGEDGVDLNVVESILSVPQLTLDGLGDVTGRRLSTISFSNATSFVAGIGIYAVTIRDGASGCPADFNADGTVDFFDYDDFVLCFEGGPCPPGTTADFNHDNSVDFFDYDDFVLAFETPC